MKHKRSSLVLIAILLYSMFVVLLPTSSVSGGTFSNHKFDLTVSLNWKASDSELGDLENTFQSFSEQLYDSTDGTHQLGTITVYNSFPLTYDDADIYLTKTTSFRTSSAHILGIFDDSQHMYMDTLDTSLVWVHEFGHYAYGVYDEYFGRHWVWLPPHWERHDAECTDDGSGAASIMDGPRTGFDEFDTPSNHDADGDTEQERLRGVSSWEYMANGEPDWMFWAFQGYDDLVIPPGDADPGPTTGADSITWVVETLEKPYIVLLIDRSGSMGGSKISDAKDSAKLFVDLMRIDDSIGVVSFASSVSVDYPLTKIASDADKTSAKNAINAISAGGMTAMGDGLRTAYNQLSHLDIDVPKAIVLLSNGWHNYGTEHPTSVIPDLQSRKIKVDTIGLGSGAQEDLLKQIASETGGTYHFAPSSSDLQSIYDGIAAEATAMRTSESAIGTIGEGEIKTEEVIVDSSASQATFTLTWGGSDLDLSLQMPNATIIDETTAATNPNVTFYEESTYKVYRVDSPLNGTWSMIIEGTYIPAGIEEYSVRATVDSPISLLASLPVISQYPMPIMISATLQKEYPIMKANVTATIIKGDGTTHIVNLYDDGAPSHGDSLPDDGVYSYVFDPNSNYHAVFDSEGLYTIKINAASNGTAIMGVAEGSEEGEPFLVNMTEPFTREIIISTTVLGVPSMYAPTIESSNSAGAKKDTFDIPEHVYVTGSNYSTFTTYDIYVVEDVAAWSDGMAIPSRVSGTATSVSSDGSGNIPATLVWTGPLVPGKYDIVVDVDSDGFYNQSRDAIDDSDIEVTAGFFVVPEVPLGTIMASAAMVIALVGYFAMPRFRKKQISVNP